MNSAQKQTIVDMLREGTVEIEFVKRDGTLRTMVATLNMDLVPSDKIPLGTGRPKPPTVQTVFDLEIDEWRSFRWETLQSWVKLS